MKDLYEFVNFYKNRKSFMELTTGPDTLKHHVEMPPSLCHCILTATLLKYFYLPKPEASKALLAAVFGSQQYS